MNCMADAEERPCAAGTERRNMADRRRRRRKKRTRTAGCLCVLAVLVGIGAFAAYALPWAGHELSGMLRNVMGRAAEETVNAVSEQGADFPELTVTVEEVEGDFYYQQLGKEEQTVYRELLQGVQGMEECILLHAGRDDQPAKVYEYLLYDRPELFWCDGSSRMTVYDSYTEFYPGYTCTAQVRDQRQSEIDAAAEACIGGIDAGASEYDRIKYVFEYIVNTVDYDEDAPDNQNIYSALVGKRSVCAGYSRAAQYLLERLGIETIYVVGSIEDQGAHAWNIVSCDGKYYQMDVTFADPVFYSAESGEKLPENVINYDFLCCTDREIAADHEQSTEVPYPVCDQDDLNYYRMNGMYYDSFDSQILLSAMNSSIYAGEEMFVCKFSGADVYAQARDAMIGGLYPRAAQNLASAYGLSSVKYTYIEDESHCKMIVFWSYEES